MQNFYNLTSTELNAAVIVLNILLSFAAAAVIVGVYRKTHRGLSYSRSFVVTLMMVCTLGSVVMMVVQENLIGAFALLGAFSMIRFRTIVKDTKDVAYVFFALVEGVAIGTGNYAIAGIALTFIAIALLVVHRKRLGAAFRTGYLIMLQAGSAFDPIKLNELFRSLGVTYHVLHIKSSGEEMEYSLAVELAEGLGPERVVSSLSALPHVHSVDLMTGKESVEY